MQTQAQSEGFNTNIFIQAYPVSSFASSADLQFQTLTGDVELRCAVSLDHHLPNFLRRDPHSIFLLAGDHG